MKVSIGTNIKEGPWGGGNLFAINLKDFLISQGHEVTNNLFEDDIDVILITEPRKTSESSAFTHIDVKRYLKYVNYDTVIVHRLNECDERKNTNFVNDYLIEANKVSDQSVYVSEWLKNLFLSQGIKSKKNLVIYGGANDQIFNSSGLKPWKNNQKLKLVTHHWGANWNKGFDVYKYVDELLGQEEWNSKISFTYIGNIPKNFSFKNSNLINPLSGLDLSKKLKENNFYITGSLNEPSGNHHIEAAQCGLPILYMDSGGTPEYCETFGVEFNINNIEEKLNYAIQNYERIQENMKNYPHNANKMSQEYLNLFENLVKDKNEIIAVRKIKKKDYGLSRKVYLLIRKISEIFSN